MTIFIVMFICVHLMKDDPIKLAFISSFKNSMWTLLITLVYSKFKLLSVLFLYLCYLQIFFLIAEKGQSLHFTIYLSRVAASTEYLDQFSCHTTRADVLFMLYAAYTCVCWSVHVCAIQNFCISFLFNSGIV